MAAKLRIAIVMISACVAGYAIAGGFPWDRGATAKGNQWAQLRIFDEVLYHISKDYVDEPDMERVRTGALRGLADGLDPYSAYLTPAQVQTYAPIEPGLNEVGGMSLSKYGGYVYVVSVLKGSPADKAGFETGDILEYIGKAATRDMSLFDAEMLLTDEKAGPIEVKMFRLGQSGKLMFTNGPVTVPSVDLKMVEPGVGYIGVPALSQGKAAEIKSAIDQLSAKGAKRLVLDLRGSAIGSLEEGAAVANLFIDSGVLARKVGRGGADTSTVPANPSATVFRGPLSVVINSSTAGAAEVVASAVLAAKRGDIVGERTFGAGVELELYRLRDGGAMLLTVAKFAPAAGKPFLEEGVSPSTEIKQQIAEIVVPEDDDANAPDGQTEQKHDDRPTPRPAPTDDVQLKKAIELLKAAGAAAAAKAA